MRYGSALLALGLLLSSQSVGAIAELNVPPRSRRSVVPLGLIPEPLSFYESMQRALRRSVGESFAANELRDAWAAMELYHLAEIEHYLRREPVSLQKEFEQVQEELQEATGRSGSLTVAIYPFLFADRLELLLIPPVGEPIRYRVPEADEGTVRRVVEDLRTKIQRDESQEFMEPAQQLYDWLIRPLEGQLQAWASPQFPQPTTLVFVMDRELRVLPIAALHDGKQFLIERYAIAQAPSFRLKTPPAKEKRTTRVLGMGLRERPSLTEEVRSLAVLDQVTTTLAGQHFTLGNLVAYKEWHSVLHLATMADLSAPEPRNAFVQLGAGRLSLHQISRWRSPRLTDKVVVVTSAKTSVQHHMVPYSLLVALQASSLLTPLWIDADVVNVPLTLGFYQHSQNQPTIALALRAAQRDLLLGRVRLEGSQVVGLPRTPIVPLDHSVPQTDLSHPFYWATFTLMGNWQ
ncbi:MAG: CHAT domain-containing protein [Oscillatoriales cyanobacterium SM2_2_1]|nr:CHAT domain-containing protein [Oscillatoriales cyanobacterium SM2_2_1]